MKQRWIWRLVSWLMIAGLAGCTQATTPLAAETVPAPSPDFVVGTVRPTLEPTATEADLVTLTQNIQSENLAKGDSDEAGKQLLQTDSPIKLTEIAQEEKVMVGSPISSPSDPALQALVGQATEDLAKRLGIAVDQIEVLEVREVVWPDSSLGCPEEGMAYEQVPQTGLLIRLGAGDRMYFYHSDKTQTPFLCEQMAEIFKVTPKVDEMVPPPDFEID